MKQPASAMLSIALSLALVTSMCPATALATGDANAQATMNAAATETSSADATSPSQSTADNRPESAAAEPAAQSYENAIAPTATTTTYAHTETAEQNGVTLTVGWNDAAPGEPTTFHLSATGGSGAYKFRMDAPFYMNPGESYFGEVVADTSRGQWMTWTSSDTGCDYEFTMTASGRYYYRFYLQDAQNGVWSLRVAAEVEVSDDAHPSVDQIITNAWPNAGRKPPAPSTTWPCGCMIGRSTSWNTTTTLIDAARKAASPVIKARAKVTNASTPSCLTPPA